MADLRDHLAGLEDVETHIQTGNVRFRRRMRSAAKVEKHVEEVLGAHSVRGAVGDLHAGRAAPGVRRRAGHRAAVVRAGRGATALRDVLQGGAAPTGEVAEQIAAWDEPGESAVVIGRAVHIWLNRPSQEAKFFGAFKKALAPGTNRDLKVVTALAERWGR